MHYTDELSDHIKGTYDRVVKINQILYAPFVISSRCTNSYRYCLTKTCPRKLPKIAKRGAIRVF